MNFTKLVKTVETVRKKPACRRSTRVGTGTPSMRLFSPEGSPGYESFKASVRGRPRGIECVVRYGRLARMHGVPYGKASSIVRKHFKKFRGYTRRSWIEKGLFTGFNQVGVIA